MTTKESASLRLIARQAADARFGADGWRSVTVTFVLTDGVAETVTVKRADAAEKCEGERK